MYTLSPDPDGSQGLTLPRQDFVNFKLIDTLRDEKDSSIYGALYVYKGESLPNIPQFVIAFRGTKLKSETWEQDIKLDAKCMANTPHDSFRLQHAMNYVREMVTSRARGASVWLAGHSLGAAIALLAGKQMFKEGHFLETYLFNPPFCSNFIASWIKNDTLSFVVFLAKSYAKAIIRRSGKYHRDRAAQAHKAYLALSNWVPHLLVNPDDPVSSEYIHYFENRQKMLEFGFEKVAIIASMETMRMALGIDSSSEAIHLIPSAILTINKVEFPGEIQGLCGKIRKMKLAHQLEQWRSPNSSFQSWDYKYQCRTL